jgi:hypothetical protein
MGTIMALVLPLASASPAEADWTFAGSCAFVGLSNPAPGVNVFGTDMVQGFLFGAVAVYGEYTPSSYLYRSTLGCELLVNEVATGVYTGSQGETVLATASPASIEASLYDVVTLCTIVAAYGADTLRTCKDADLQCVPYVAGPGVGCVWSVATKIIPEEPEPAICSFFATLGPGIPGLVDISSAGNVTVLGEPMWYCDPMGLRSASTDTSNVSLSPLSGSRPLNNQK